jgi:hypothetical protein
MLRVYHPMTFVLSNKNNHLQYPLRITTRKTIMQTEPARFSVTIKDLNEAKNNKYSNIQRFSRAESSWVPSLRHNKLLCTQMSRELYDTYAYFWVADFDCEQTEITEKIGLEPTRVVLEGELLKTGRPRRRSLWEFHSSLPRTETFQDKHLEDLMGQLLPKELSIKEISMRFNTGISCVGYYQNVNFGFHMSAELLQQCAQLGLSVDFDLYNSCEPS